MSVQEWRSELFSLYRKCREHQNWPKNFNDALEWMDEDARDYLLDLDRLHDTGAMLLKRGGTK
jgi:hypothetical protein